MKVKGKVNVMFDTSYAEYGEYYLRLKIKYKLPGDWLSSTLEKTLNNYNRSNLGNNDLSVFIKRCLIIINDKDYLKKEAEQMLSDRLKKLVKNSENKVQIEILEEKLKDLNQEFIIEVEV